MCFFKKNQYTFRTGFTILDYKITIIIRPSFQIEIINGYNMNMLNMSLWKYPPNDDNANQSVAHVFCPSPFPWHVFYMSHLIMCLQHSRLRKKLCFIYNHHVTMHLQTISSAVLVWK